MKQYTREEIYNEVVGIMNKLFEIPTDEITSESKLMDDQHRCSRNDRSASENDRKANSAGTIPVC